MFANLLQWYQDEKQRTQADVTYILPAVLSLSFACQDYFKLLVQMS